ncbi:phage tail protein [Chitinophaga oryzae]|uniref:Phage tail protein n=1 Tax=Chitinophaga oryzae TaxID=2725414 RepID=A0AAE6ZG42_9BACT|nr:phage tail protein [Chitinophaga oryzae]QJB32066.1 phage tail protein [Chitinophaga oryzae]QJB38543.1 phage tail protein [Chitinophaga oryzae]
MPGYYPPVGFHFKVEFTGLGKSDNDTRFQAVTGLTVEYETETVKEGGENRFEHTLPVRTKYPDLTLKRGMLLTDSKIFEWCMKAFQDREFTPSDIVITLLNNEHEPIRTWNISQAWPKKWSITELNAETSSIVVESLDLRYRFFTVS